MTESNEKGEKITKLLAACGHGSRRSCEELIDMLRVTINGRVAERGDRVHEGDDVRLDNRRVKLPSRHYYKIYKPKGVLCNETPQKNAPHINDIIPKLKVRLYPVGRLDKDFEGLMIYTNDGEICNRLTHPRYQCPKVFEVRVHGFVPDKAVEKISRGIFLSEGKTAPIKVTVKKRSQERSVLHLEIHENRRRLIPRVFANQELHVERIKRISVGPIRLTGMKIGEFSQLSDAEVAKLRKAAYNATEKTVYKKKSARYDPNKFNKKKKKTGGRKKK